MGFSTSLVALRGKVKDYKSQSLSGWGGVFNAYHAQIAEKDTFSRNPFQGGVGFSTHGARKGTGTMVGVAIPFRVGWGFQPSLRFCRRSAVLSRNPFQGGVGFSTRSFCRSRLADYTVAIPFRVGWGFQPGQESPRGGAAIFVAIPFRVGWGFQRRDAGSPEREASVAIPFRVGWGFQPSWYGILVFATEVAIPFRVGWGFQLGELEKQLPLPVVTSQSLSGWGGVFNIMGARG